jgi:hypothetical protein
MASSFDQDVSLTASTAKAVEVPAYYSMFDVTNETADPLYVQSNGSAATTAEGGSQGVVEPSTQRTFGNAQPRQPAAGVAGDALEPGWTVQGNINPLASGYPTYVSLLSAAAGTVHLEFL